MTSKLKCPVCNVPLTACGDLLSCPNDRCAWLGNAELWQALIQSQKDLEKSKERCSAWEKKVLDWQMKAFVRNAKLKIAKSALRQIESRLVISPEIVARKALEQIEHKEI